MRVNLSTMMMAMMMAMMAMMMTTICISHHAHNFACYDDENYYGDVDIYHRHLKLFPPLIMLINFPTIMSKMNIFVQFFCHLKQYHFETSAWGKSSCQLVVSWSGKVQ